jgi:hypothetical protein
MQVSRRKVQAKPADGEQSPLEGRILVALLSKATYLPSALMAESRLWPLTAEPSNVTVILVVLGVQPGGAPTQVSRS